MEELTMKNPMIENNINTELFEAIDENEVNGGLIGFIGDGNRVIISSAITLRPSFKNACLTVVTKDFRCLNTSLRIQCSIRLGLK